MSRSHICQVLKLQVENTKLERTWHGLAFMRHALKDAIDEFDREGLRIEFDTTLSAALVIQALNELMEVRGAPLCIRLDNGPEFIAQALSDWAKSKGISFSHIQLGKPTQNGYVERFNRRTTPKYWTTTSSYSLQYGRDMTAVWLHQ